MTLTTFDYGVAAILSQHCCLSVRDKNLKATNLECIRWVEKIFVMDYGHYELVVLYYNWMVANTVGQIATIKQDDSSFRLVKFKKLVSLTAKSFVFALHVEQFFFADNLNSFGWKVVI